MFPERCWTNLHMRSRARWVHQGHKLLCPSKQPQPRNCSPPFPRHLQLCYIPSVDVSKKMKLRPHSWKNHSWHSFYRHGERFVLEGGFVQARYPWKKYHKKHNSFMCCNPIDPLWKWRRRNLHLFLSFHSPWKHPHLAVMNCCYWSWTNNIPII